MKELKLIIVFRECENDVDYVKKEARNFFNQYYENQDVDCNINIEIEKNIDNDSIYKATLYELPITLIYENCDSDFYPGGQFENIVKDWCDSCKNRLSHLWLRLYNRSVLTINAKQFHRDVDVQEIAFGTFPTMQHFMQHYHYEIPSLDDTMIGSFFHNQKYFIIYASVSHFDKHCQYLGQSHSFRVQYNSLARVLINVHPSEDSMQLYFFTKYLPFIFIGKKSQSENDDSFSPSSDQEYQELYWERSLGFGCKCSHSNFILKRIGKCRVFKIVIKKSSGFGIIERLIQRCAPDTYFFFTNCSKKLIRKKSNNFNVFPHNEEYLQSLEDPKEISDIKFACQYAWEVLLGRSLEVEDQIIRKDVLSKESGCIYPWELIKHEIQEAVRSLDALVHSLYHISDMITSHEIFVFEEAFRDLFHHYQEYPPKIELPPGMCLVHRLIIMPSGNICLQPTEHFDNRVLREFGSKNFLRVSIQDDNFSKLTFGVRSRYQKEQFMKYIKEELMDGICIGNRHYVMLASSNSQLREHGLWMFAADHEGRNAASIRRWMGDFSKIKSVAKYMARLGQCFSSSEEAAQIEIDDTEVITIEDFKNEKYVFSDGIGMISTEITEKVREALYKKVPMTVIKDRPTYKPSAFQIRFKGCKGMLAENPNLEGRQLAIRPSMKKFECENSNMLEIVKISAPRALFLNRPLISLLEQLGIKAKVFLKLMKNMVSDMTESLIYEKKAYKRLAVGTSLDFPFKKLLKSGICLTEEPFFRRLLLSVYTVAIDQLRYKARIAIPPQYGRNMLGVIDETNSLKYGQVFVQYSEELDNNNESRVLPPLKGPVIVTKNPCMHPGDIRKLEAVDVPLLHHIKDCIVFPAHGPRPHPDEMAGSDLDGDEFVVIWHKDLILEKSNEEAMEYPSNTECVHPGKIKVSDMINFLCTYIQNDNVGLMANAHLVWADYHPLGIFSPVCKSIAQKYPLALDFAKSGIPECLKREEKPKKYPDFMEKGCVNNSYNSKKALGQLYRFAKTLEACVSKFDLNDVEVCEDSTLIYPGWEEYEESAKMFRCKYVKRVNNILKKYGLRSEVEALSGYAGKLNDFSENRYERDNALSIARTYMKDTIKRFRTTFIRSHFSECEKYNVEDRREIQVRKYKRASAWYVVTYMDCDKSILSFPWAVSDIICEMRRDLGDPPPIPKSLFIESSDKILSDTYSSIQSITMTTIKTVCNCLKILNNIIYKWVNKSSLLLTLHENQNFCSFCFERIITTFTDSKSCCSISKTRECECSESCSPMKFLLEFMKFYLIHDVKHIQNCGNPNGCNGFRAISLQSLAVQTYASLAVTRNCLEILDGHFIGGDGSEEGDPIRVSVPSEFEEIIVNHYFDFKDKLKAKTGVKDIFIYLDKDFDGNYYILVHSVGKPYQRHAVKEFMLDEEITTIARALLKL